MWKPWKKTIWKKGGVKKKKKRKVPPRSNTTRIIEKAAPEAIRDNPGLAREILRQLPGETASKAIGKMRAKRKIAGGNGSSEHDLVLFGYAAKLPGAVTV